MNSTGTENKVINKVMLPVFYSADPARDSTQTRQEIEQKDPDFKIILEESAGGEVKVVIEATGLYKSLFANSSATFSILDDEEKSRFSMEEVSLNEQAVGSFVIQPKHVRNIRTTRSYLTVRVERYQPRQ